MANPQKEDGHIQIATEIWDALCRTRIPGEQMQVLMVILRKTYGFNKKRDGIPLSQFAEITGIKRPNIVRAIKGLLSKKIIAVIKKDNKYWNEYEFVKDFEQWEPLSKKITSVIKKDNASLSKKIHSINNDSKDKKKSKKEKFNPTQQMINKGADMSDIKSWLSFRGQRKKPVTERVLSLIDAEAKKANISFSEAIKICADEQWLSFKAGWNHNLPAQHQVQGGLVY